MRGVVPVLGERLVFLMPVLLALHGCASLTVQGEPPPSPKPAFLVRNYGGKCLDYNESLQGTGLSVFLNNCARAHPIRVHEINGEHDVILYAGTHVLARRVDETRQPGRDAPAASPQTGYVLELRDPVNPNSREYGEQIFSLDGDSIILSKSRPCFNTHMSSDPASLCPPPPPELVVQAQNARGADKSPLVVAPRTLVDNEFWDFVAIDGSGSDPTNGFLRATTPMQLWNAVCASPLATFAGPARISDPGQPDDGEPAACAQFNAGRGSVIVITSPNPCPNVPAGEEPGHTEDVGPCIDMSDFAPLVLPAGVTLRGDRRGVNLGPQLYAAYFGAKTFLVSQGITNCDSCMIQVDGDYVRITGLRLRGQTRTKHKIKYANRAIDVDPVPASRIPRVHSATEFIVTIDHNDISDWTEAAIWVIGGQQDGRDCVGVRNDQETQNNVHIARNFLHHNERWSGGYGVNVGRAFIEGNLFLMNRHAVASGGDARDQYRAWYNLVLRRVPDYTDEDSGKISDVGPQQDFDMHGSGSGGYGGVGGYEVDIAGNTLLGHAEWGLFSHPRPNFELRGYPCVTEDYFRNNVTRQNRDNTIFLHKIEGTVNREGSDVPVIPVPPPTAPQPCNDIVCGPPATVRASNDQYFDSSGFSDPTDGEHVHPFGVGDFDGDRVQDLFYATGAAWYFSPGGRAEWRFLSAKPDKLDGLLLGDFDGDGRTDVVAKRGDSLFVSWGGISDWELLNSDPNLARVSITDLAVGRFLDHPADDRRDDIFLADGAAWYLSLGGSGPFNPAATSHKRVSDLRFGDFDGDGKTDVFGVVLFGPNDWRWAFSKSAQGAWGDGVLRSAARTARGHLLTVDDLIVADFDGDGRADVATNANSPNDWRISFDGVGEWTHFGVPDTGQCGYQPAVTLPMNPAIGRFDGNAGVDILFWDGRVVETPPTSGGNNEMCIAPGGNVPGQVGWATERKGWSRQDMR